jgi:hypothetical protein
MTYDRAVGCLAARLPGLAPAVRAEVAATAIDSGRARGGSRLRELAALAGLFVELTARRQTRGRRVRVRAQGAAAGPATCSA